MLVTRYVKVAHDAYEACNEADALLVVTEWDEFRDLDYHRIHDSMKKPAFVFDGRLILDHKRLSSIGFEVRGVGKPHSSTMTIRSSSAIQSAEESLSDDDGILAELDDMDDVEVRAEHKDVYLDTKPMEIVESPSKTETESCFAFCWPCC